MAGFDEHARFDTDLDAELAGLDRDDPEVQAFAEHLHRIRRASPSYTIEGYLAGVADFADSTNRAVGLRRQAAVVVAVLLLLGVVITVLESLGTILSTVF